MVWLALVTAQLSVAIAGAAPAYVAPSGVSSAGMHVALPGDAHLAAAGTTPTVSPAPGTSPSRQTAPGTSAPRILVGGALLVAAFFMLLRRRGQIRPPSPRRAEPGVDEPDRPAEGPPRGPSA